MDATSTKSSVLDAAARVFIAHGFRAASMDMVRREARVSNGSLYHHFPTKNQLADALYATILFDLHASLLAPLDEGAGAEAAVKGVVGAYIEWVADHPELARLLNELRHTAGIAGGQETEAANAAGFGALSVWVKQRAAAGEMRALPFPVWMALVLSPAMALTPRWVQQASPDIPPRIRAALKHAAWASVAP